MDSELVFEAASTNVLVPIGTPTITVPCRPAQQWENSEDHEVADIQVTDSCREYCSLKRREIMIQYEKKAT
jgi:hypothetical protein